MIRLSSLLNLTGITGTSRGLKSAVKMSGPVATSIKMKISSKLNPTHLDVINESYMHNVPDGAESHFKVVVISDKFENKPLIQRHRMVNELLSEEFNNGLHALSIVAKTPSQWEESNKKMFHSTENTNLSKSHGVVDETMQSSFIVQSVERLFGRGALAQAFYSPLRRKSSHKLKFISMVKEVNLDDEEDLGNSPPVMKLLQPEIRVQLTSPRSSSDFSRSALNKSHDGFNQQVTGDNTVTCTAVKIKKEDSAVIKSIKDINIGACNNTMKVKSHSSESAKRHYVDTCGDSVKINPVAFDHIDACDFLKMSTLPVQLVSGTDVDNFDKAMQGDAVALESADGNLVDAGDEDVHPVRPARGSRMGTFKHIIKSSLSNESEKRSHDTCGDIVEKVALPVELFTKFQKGTEMTGDQVEASNSEEVAEKHGHIFLKKLDEQVKDLECVACQCEEDIKTCDSEEGKGELRATAGKARLLIAEKLSQFRGLCQKNISNSDTYGFPTKNEDLAGFWDMVSIQVDDIMRQYERTKTLKENHWKMPSVTDGKVTKPPMRSILTTRSKNINSIINNQRQPMKPQSEANKARDAARRRMLRDKRQAIRQQTHCPTNSNLQDTLKTV